MWIYEPEPSRWILWTLWMKKYNVIQCSDQIFDQKVNVVWNVIYSGFQANMCKTLLYSRFQAKLCGTFLALVWITSLSAYSNVYNTQLGSHTNDVLSIGATEIIRYGHRTPENTIEYQTFFKIQKFVFSGVL